MGSSPIFLVMLNKNLKLKNINNKANKTSLINYKDNSDYQTRLNTALAQFILSASSYNNRRHTLLLGIVFGLLVFTNIVSLETADSVFCLPQDMVNNEVTVSTSSLQDEKQKISPSASTEEWNAKEFVVDVLAMVIGVYAIHKRWGFGDVLAEETNRQALVEIYKKQIDYLSREGNDMSQIRDWDGR